MKKTTLLLVNCFILGLLIQSCTSCQNSNKNADEITLADASIVWWMAPGIIAKKDSIFEKNGLKVKSFDVQTGLASKNAVLSGSSDLGLVASTPLALGAFNHDNLLILCSYIESNYLLSVITTKDTARYSLPTTPVATVKGTISEIYLYNYLTENYKNEREQIIKDQLNVKPPDVANAMKSGDAKSAVIWEPFGTQIYESNKSLYKENRDPNIYTHRMYVVCTPETLKKKRNAINKFIKSLEQACELINKQPDFTKGIIKTVFPQQESSMNALWNKVDFSVNFDYEKMKDLLIKDAEINYQLNQTPKVKSGQQHRRLVRSEIEYYFNHDYILQ